MKPSLLILVLASFSVSFAMPGPRSESPQQPRETADSINGIYIPHNTAECMTELDKHFSDTLKCEIRSMPRDKFLGLSHLGLGMWVRNAFGLWADSRLARYLRDSCKLEDPDEMSWHILEKYHNHLMRSDEKN